VKKIFFGLLLLVSLQGCGPTAAIIGSGVTTLASTGSLGRAAFTAGTGFYIEQQTGQSTLEYVAENTLEADLRTCEINHSAEINKIFFQTLDEFDCKLIRENYKNLEFFRR